MIYIYGASDDLIEIEGDLREEFTMPASDKAWLGLSNGTLIKVTYDGEWNFKPVGNADDGDFVTVHLAGSKKAVELSERDYSDVVVVENITIDWVVLGEDVVK